MKCNFKNNFRNSFVTKDIDLRNKLIDHLYSNKLPYAYTEANSIGEYHIYANVYLESLVKML